MWEGSVDHLEVKSWLIINTQFQKDYLNILALVDLLLFISPSSAVEPVIEADQDPVADQDVVVEDPLISEEDEAVVLEEHIPYQLALVSDQVSLDEDDES